MTSILFFRTVFVVAEKNIIAYNAKNGKRLAILKFSESQLAFLVLNNKVLLFSLSAGVNKYF